MIEALTQVGARSASIELRPAEHVRIHPRQWEAQVESTRHELRKDEVAEADQIVAEAFRDMRFLDELGMTWTHDGRTWLRWDAPSWVAATPPSSLRPMPFTMELVVAPEPVAGFGWYPNDDPDDIPDEDGDEPEVYIPTNRVPAGGLPAWILPDPVMPIAATLDPGLDVMTLEWRDDGWAQIRCSNDWVAWVDGELLDPL